MRHRLHSKLHILLVSAALLLTAGCGSAEPAGSLQEEAASETQAPIYSSNVPLEYLAMANQSSALRMNHDRVHVTSRHLLYPKARPSRRKRSTTVPSMSPPPAPRERMRSSIPC